MGTRTQKGQKRGHVDAFRVFNIKENESTRLVRFGGSRGGRILEASVGSVGRILGIQGLARNSGQEAWGNKGPLNVRRAPIEGCPWPDHGFGVN